MYWSVSLSDLELEENFARRFLRKRIQIRSVEWVMQRSAHKTTLQANVKSTMKYLRSLVHMTVACRSFVFMSFRLHGFILFVFDTTLLYKIFIKFIQLYAIWHSKQLHHKVGVSCRQSHNFLLTRTRALVTDLWQQYNLATGYLLAVLTKGGWLQKNGIIIIAQKCSRIIELQHTHNRTMMYFMASISVR